MKTTVQLHDFRSAFQQCNREDQFSYDGLTALFNFFQSCEDGMDTEIELDVIGICCEYTEYKNLRELQDVYSDIKSIEDLEDHTSLIPIDSSESFIIQNY